MKSLFLRLFLKGLKHLKYYIPILWKCWFHEGKRQSSSGVQITTKRKKVSLVERNHDTVSQQLYLVLVSCVNLFVRECLFYVGQQNPTTPTKK